MKLPLEGIRVVDLSRVLAGPYCTMMLGDMGAEVVKVEMPGQGDDSRQFGPPFVEGESAYYLAINRNKLSITLNLKAEKARKILRELVACSDILVENFRVGTMERLGLSYDSLRQINPRLIYCSVTAYGSDGPYAEQPGYDFIIQAQGGIMSVTGEPDGEPMKLGIPIVDITTGMLASSAILAALRVRDATGEGQKVELSLLEAELAWMTNVASSYLLTGKTPERFGNAHPNIVPYQAFRARDGYIAVAVGNDRQYQRFCEIIGCSDQACDPRFATNGGRVAHRKELVVALQAVFAQRDVAEWLSLLEKAEIPCGPINSLEQVFADPQVQARQVVMEVPHPTVGTVRMVGFPYRFSRTPLKVRHHPPLLGEHTAQVLKNPLGYTDEQIAQLRAEKAI